MNLIPVALAATEEAKQTSGFDFTSLAGKVLLAIVVIFLAIFAGILVRSWIKRVIENRQGDAHKELVLLYGRIAFTACLVFGLVFALIIAGAPLEIFSGALGLGIALAMQGPVANFFAGILLLSNDKFNLGDFVIVNGAESGTIVDIQSRATTLRGIDGAEITIPNSDMLTAKITCYTRNPVRRQSILVGVGYGTDLNQAKEIIIGLIKKNPGVEPEPEPIVLVNEIGASAITLEARFWTDTKSKWWTTKSDLTSTIFAALTQAGVDIPYPVQTLRVDAASSDLLAAKPDLLNRLTQIESSKQAVFAPVPAEPAGETLAQIQSEERQEIAQDLLNTKITTEPNSQIIR